MIEDMEGTTKEFSLKDWEDPSRYDLEESLLYNADTRQSLLNDLEELYFFMKQRLAELTSKE